MDDCVTAPPFSGWSPEEDTMEAISYLPNTHGQQTFALESLGSQIAWTERPLAHLDEERGECLQCYFHTESGDRDTVVEYDYGAGREMQPIIAVFAASSQAQPRAHRLRSCE